MGTHVLRLDVATASGTWQQATMVLPDREAAGPGAPWSFPAFRGGVIRRAPLAVDLRGGGCMVLASVVRVVSWVLLNRIRLLCGGAVGCVFAWCMYRLREEDFCKLVPVSQEI